MSDAASLEWIIEEEDAERPRALSDAQRAAIRVAIASALTADEVDRLEEMLEQGIIPGQETIPGQEPITGEDPAPAAHAGDAEDVDVAPEAVAAAPAAEVPLARGVEDAPVARGVEGARKRLRASEGAAPPASEGAADRRRPPAVESDLGAAALWAQRLLLSRFGCGSPGSAPRRLRGVAAPRRLFGVERQERDLYERLRVAATSAESTSIILCGARGSGKHTTLQSVLRRLRQTAPPGRPDADGATEDGAAAAEEAPLRKVPHFDVVRLSGLDHAQAAVGICELARQLLAVDDGQACRQRGAAASYWDNESLVRAELRRRRQTGAAPLLVVLSHFESFATRDTRQTLLYLLLDAIGDDGARIVIVGITADLHVLELLEKRVRSRLQNHHVVFPTARLPDVCGMLDDKMFLHLEDVDDDGDLWKEWPTFLEKHNTAWRLAPAARVRGVQDFDARRGLGRAFDEVVRARCDASRLPPLCGSGGRPSVARRRGGAHADVARGVAQRRGAVAAGAARFGRGISLFRNSRDCPLQPRARSRLPRPLEAGRRQRGARRRRPRHGPRGAFSLGLRPRARLSQNGL
ncbi:hypothetical protein M885DRAFT_505293 [Pelagophyceae sp. CCMP2097]|nr:hypothetical protein M885DRAFT_505293 [Pelagophyceae sp. CCMP2097]